MPFHGNWYYYYPVANNPLGQWVAAADLHRIADDWYGKGFDTILQHRCCLACIRTQAQLWLSIRNCECIKANIIPLGP
jgi:hypothetical protein